jgi:hypothetical protein
MSGVSPHIVVGIVIIRITVCRIYVKHITVVIDIPVIYSEVVSEVQIAGTYQKFPRGVETYDTVRVTVVICDFVKIGNIEAFIRSIIKGVDKLFHDIFIIDIIDLLDSFLNENLLLLFRNEVEIVLRPCKEWAYQ